MTTETLTCVLFTGGGTGGHLFPGVAVARELARRSPATRIVFVGSGRDVESRVLSKEGLSLERVRAVGLVGRSVTAVARGLAILPAGFLDAWRVLRRHQPGLVVGLGGYSSGPVMALAALKGIPTLLLEQNAVPGVTNRLLSSLVRAAAVSYEAALPHFGSVGFVSGNPVRQGFFDLPAPRPTLAQPHILVLGGSQGAHTVNLAMIEAAPRITAAWEEARFTHQSGEADLDLVREGYRLAGATARVEPFLDGMDREMAEADVIVCRAGATTLAELAAAGRAAILVPYPHATHDHQRRNAAVVAQAGAAEVIDPADLSGLALSERLLELIADDRRRLALADANRRLGTPDAARLIVDRMERLLAPGD